MCFWGDRFCSFKSLVDYFIQFNKIDYKYNFLTQKYVQSDLNLAQLNDKNLATQKLNFDFPYDQKSRPN